MLTSRGQSTLEYVIVLTAIIAVVISFAAGTLKSKTEQSLNDVSSAMEAQVSKISY